MAMEKEALTHKIEDDLAARNRNWDKVDSLQTAHDDLEAAHAAHLAESSSKHITESGNNANGYYIKFDDGTLICWHSLEFTGGSGIWTFPASFFSIPIVQVTPQYYTTLAISLSLGNVSTTSSTIRTNSVTANQGAHVMAIGRWK